MTGFALLALGDVSTWLVAVLLACVLCVGGVAALAVRLVAGDADAADGPRTQRDPRPTHALTVAVVDPVAGETADVDGSVGATPHGRSRRERGAGRATAVDDAGDGDNASGGGADDDSGDGGDAGDARRVRLRDGRATLRLPAGDWGVSVETPAASERTRVRLTDDRTVTVRAPPVELRVRCLDADTGDPVADATVTCRVSTGDDRVDATDDDGDVRFELPRHVAAADLVVERDGYETATRLAKLDGDVVGVEFSLQPTGRLPDA